MATRQQPAPWRRVKWTKAGQLAALARAETALDGLQDASPPLAFALLRADNPQVAVRFIAQCLPRFEAVRWLNECLGRVPAPPHGTLRAETRAAIAGWLADPSDKRRRLVFDHAQAIGYDVPEGAAGLAVFLSGGALGPPDLEHGAPPVTGAFGQAVAGAVVLASLAQGSSQFVDQLDAMLGLGAAIAEAEDQS